MKIRIGIFGYGNLGRGIENAIRQNDDMELVAVFTRRAPESLKIGTNSADVRHVSAVDEYIGRIDVMILCGGSATDLPVQTPELAKKFYASLGDKTKVMRRLLSRGYSYSVIESAVNRAIDDEDYE